MRKLKKILAGIFLFCVCATNAQNNICYYLINTGNGNMANNTDVAKAYISWETDNEGRIIISIHPYGNNPCEVRFRENSITNPVTFFQTPATNMKVDNVAIGANNAAGSFFAWSMNTEQTKVTFVPLQAMDDYLLEHGSATITYGNQPVRYETRRVETIGFALATIDASNASINFSYTYNGLPKYCGTTPLTTPTISSITGDGVITFATSANATGYRAFIRNESDVLVYTQNLPTSGATLDVKIPATYSVVVRALDNTATYREMESASFPWTCTYAGEPAGLSNYCTSFFNPEPNATNPNIPLYNFDQATADATDAHYFTWQTVQEAGTIETQAVLPGDLVVSLTDYMGAATFRGGMSLKNLYVGGLSGELFFDRVGATNNIKTQTFRPKTGVTILAGTPISYYGRIEVKVNTLNLGGNYTFDGYKYGAICNNNQLIQPMILGIENDGVITFSPTDARASGFLVEVKNGGNVVHSQTLTASGETINYSTLGTYQVTLTAIGTGNYVNSEPSDPYQWKIRAVLPTPTITSISNLGLINFAPADPNASGFLVEVKTLAGVAVASETVLGSGSIITVPSPNIYNVYVTALGDDDYIKSAVSAAFAWTVTDNLDYSSWCRRYIDGGQNTGSNNDAALFTIETGLEGELRVYIEGVEGHTAAFRSNGIWGQGEDPDVNLYLNNFSVGAIGAHNGSAYFIKDYDNSNTSVQVFKLKPGGQTLAVGTHIWYDGKIEIITTRDGSINGISNMDQIIPVNNNLYSRFKLDDYIYGTNCDNAPLITADKLYLQFKPIMETGMGLINVTGSHLQSAVSVVLPKGYEAVPSVLTPDASGNVNQLVTVKWTGGSLYRSIYFQGVGLLTFQGGGVNSLHNAPRVRLFGTGFSCTSYSSLFLGDGGGSDNRPVYMNLSLNSDSTALLVALAPYEPTGNVIWATGTASLAGGKIKINDIEVAVTRTLPAANTIQLALPSGSRFNEGDIVSFRGLTATNQLRWTISGYPPRYQNTIDGTGTDGSYADGTGSVQVSNWTVLNTTATDWVIGNECLSLSCPVIANAVTNGLGCTQIPESAIDATSNQANIYMNIVAGTYPIENVTFSDVDGVLPNVVFNAPLPANGIYNIPSLQQLTSYTYNIVVTDNHGNTNSLTGNASCQNIFVAFQTLSNVVTPLQKPTITNITPTGVITFAPADPMASSFTVIVKNSAEATVHTQTIYGSGDIINFSTLGVYSVTVQARGGGIYSHSDVSDPYTWTLSATLAKPTIQNITPAGVITFAPVAQNATNFEVIIKNAQNETVHTQTVNSSGATLNFSDAGVYSVTVQAIGDGTVYLNSPVSEVYVWTISAILAKPTISNITNGGIITFTPVAQNATNFEVIVKNALSAVVHTQSINSTGAAINFSTEGSYAVTIQAKGDNVVYFDSEVSEPYLWVIQGGVVNPETLEKPVITNITNNGSITFAPADQNADYFFVIVKNSNGDIVHSQIITSGGSINYSVAGTYNVTVTAIGSGVYENVISDPYTWVITSENPVLEQPVITNITNNGVITFAPADQHATYFIVTIKDGQGNVVHTQIIASSGDIIYFSTEGEYDVTVTAVGGGDYVNVVSNVYVWTIVVSGIDEATENQISIFPNPAVDELFIINNEQLTMNNVRILDITGKTVLDTHYSLLDTHSINVSGLASGIYFLQINNQVIKFIKK
ncbi:MAG: T9SS type A sorting domain-containing protein [Prevotellaceae bacterium]|jgi:hypothetical protein|nr:T9SS type A sorting domain-containing protein [Prevotellaceae bacterium]